LRLGEYHPHVEAPKPPVPVFGDPRGFQQMHDGHVGVRRTPMVKEGQISERAIRTDRHTLFTIVASYPTPTTTVKGSSEELARFKRWVNLTVAWVQERYGDQLKTAFAHTDEKYPHLHFWLLPNDPSGDATCLHPGKVAKRETVTRLKAEGTPPREAVKAGNRALKDTMRDWIDDYHRTVGAPLGMRRDGPKRRRLSRSQYMAEQAMLNHQRQLEVDRVRLEAEVAVLEDTTATLVALQREIEMKANAFVGRAERHHNRMRDEARQIAALNPMLDALVIEIENRTIEFDPEAGWRFEDPSPFRAAGKVWVKLQPAVKRLVAMAREAEDGSWAVGSKDPEYTPLARPDPNPFEASL